LTIKKEQPAVRKTAAELAFQVYFFLNEEENYGNDE
jgi:hypothetical protein